MGSHSLCPSFHTSCTTMDSSSSASFAFLAPAQHMEWLDVTVPRLVQLSKNVMGLVHGDGGGSSMC